MNPLDPKEVQLVVEDNPGIKGQAISEALNTGHNYVRRRLKRLRENGLVIALGHSVTSGWYTVKYYEAHKEELDIKHSPKELRENPRPCQVEDMLWEARVTMLDKLMIRPSLCR